MINKTNIVKIVVARKASEQHEQIREMDTKICCRIHYQGPVCERVLFLCNLNRVIRKNHGLKLDM